MGASYAYQDHDVVKGKSYRYQLEDVDGSGQSAFKGPVQAAAGTIRPVSPATGSAALREAAPYFIWESTPYDRFRIQVSARADFGGKVLALAGPQAKGKAQWIKEFSYTPTAAEWKRVKLMLGKGRTLYWRVFGKDRYGTTFTSRVNALKIMKH